MKKGPATKSKADVAAATSSSGAENVDGKSGVRGAPGAKPATAYSPPCTRSQERRFEKQIQDHRQLETPKKRSAVVPKHRAQLKGLENLPAPKDPSAGDALKSKEPGKTAKPPAKDKAGYSPDDPEPKTTPNVKDLPKPQEGRTAGAAPLGKTAAAAAERTRRAVRWGTPPVAAAEGPTKSNRRFKKAEAPKSKADVAAATSSSGAENVDGKSGVRGAPGAKPATAYSPPCTRSQERRFEKQIQDHRQLETPKKRSAVVPKHRAQLKGLENLPAPKDPSAGDALKSKEPGKTAKPPAKDKAGDSPDDSEPKTTPNVKDLPKPQEGCTAGAAPLGKTAAAATERTRRAVRWATPPVAAAEGPTKSNRRVKKAEAS